MFVLPLLLLLLAAPALATTADPAWLRYSPIQDQTVLERYHALPATVVALGSSLVMQSARSEISRGVKGMLGRTLRQDSALPTEDSIVLATTDALRELPELAPAADLPEDGYILRSTAARGQRILLIAGPNDRGVLYGAFALLRKIVLHQQIAPLDERQSPYAPIRWTNEWDNLDGSIERGYGGRSFFFSNGAVLPNLDRAAEYARLLASIGINGCTVNNVNADLRTLEPQFMQQLTALDNVFRAWGIRMSISVDFSSPKTVGHLDSFDPLDPKVAAWWKDKAGELYRAVPDLAGILMKADSEGRLGPSTYNRTPADAANVVARALKPHGGVLVYRAFVYNHHMDWRDLKNDRARAAYDNFAKLDGKFDDNVLVQIKYGPIDFQVREPVSPLIGALHHTSETLELQITQEYTGQQRQLCFLLPMWKEILHSDLHQSNDPTFVKDIVSGNTFHRPLGGFVGVADVGDDNNWLGSYLAMSNLYAFGRIAWNPNLASADVIDEWTRLTFGHDSQVVDTIDSLQLRSWPVYENYTGFLGVGGLTDITGSHYGPGIESSERNGWGQWHRADEHGIGMDRTVATGAGYTAQYAPALGELYESLKTCPDNLLLFMHHVAYDYVLHSGKTLIQHVYDTHYDGAEEAQTFPRQWERLRGRIDDDRFASTLAMLDYQAGYAIVWRDAICNWFYRESKIPDTRNRVGHHPDRIEAESMSLEGYEIESITPWEDASDGKAVTCARSQCAATTKFEGTPGWYDVSTLYFDGKDGAARFIMQINGQPIDTWTADAQRPVRRSYADASTRRTTAQVALRPGDQIQILGATDNADKAQLDYLEIQPVRPIP